jgi:hypothetical protein
MMRSEKQRRPRTGNTNKLLSDSRNASSALLVLVAVSRDYVIIIRSLVDTVSRAKPWLTERRLLSIVAADLPMQLLKAQLSVLMNGKIKTA